MHAQDERRILAALRAWLVEDTAALRMRQTDALGLDQVLLQEKGALPSDRTAADPIGLALSGGGIRSATFCLGVLQTLAREQRLGSFDYLSTVSGGGYIGCWLSAWVYRSNLKHVEDALGRRAASPAMPADNDEPVEVTRLRKLSNYLSPRLGLFSLDTLTLIATWCRNVLMNFILLFTTAATILMLPRLLVLSPEVLTGHAGALGAFALTLVVIVLVATAYNLWQQERRSQGWLTSQAGVFWAVIAPTLLAAFLASVWIVSASYNQPGIDESLIIMFAVFLFLTIPWIVVARFFQKFPWGQIAKATGVYALAFAVALWVVLLALDQLHSLWALRVTAQDHVARMAVFGELITVGPAAIVLSFALGAWIFIGLTGSQYLERSREWWSRTSAWLIALASGWLIVCTLALFVPAVVSKAWNEAPALLAAAAGSGWIGSALLAVLGARAQPASPLAASVMRRAVRIAAIVFSIGLILAVAWLANWVLLKSAGLVSVTVPPVASGSFFALEVDQQGATVQSNVLRTETKSTAALPAYLNAGFQDLRNLHAAPSYDVGSGPWLLKISPLQATLLVLVAVTLLFSLRVDINTFSLHNLYKNRLVRCYLGASNRGRCAARFTGFDDDDDIPLAALASQRPFHLINAAINITYGRNLAWQERMAGPFTLSGLHCGTTLPRSQGDDSSFADNAVSRAAYRASTLYSSKGTEKGAFTLGMAMTTSGAAVSPNRGPGTTPAVAFLLTLFNGRLGRWSPNPFQRAWERASPRMSIAPLLQELFGFSDVTRRFVYLSDGGFFDNLGLYELVRRKCRLIVVVDATADERRDFTDLGESIRKCRMDLGVEITFSDRYLLDARDRQMRASEGFAKGEIDYGDGQPGVLLYVKPTLRAEGGEPDDVIAYAARNPTFPHQTTVDQFFSESQFESYRKLGEFISARCLQRHGVDVPRTQLEAPAPTEASKPNADDQRTHAIRWSKRAMRSSFVAFVVILVVMCLISRQWLGGTCPPDPLTLLTTTSKAARVWYWSDFFLIASYTLFFMIGHRLVTLCAFASQTIRARMMLLSILILLALAGAAADLMENFLALSALDAHPEHAVDVLTQMGPWTRAKMALFCANAVAVAIGLAWTALRGRKVSHR